MPKIWNVIENRPTVYTPYLHVGVHVAHIAYERTYICTIILTLSLIFCSSGRSNKRGDIIKTTGLHTFSRKTFISNSQLLVSDSEQRHITTYGYATYWNSSGYFEFYHTVRKWRVKVSSKSAVLSPGQYNE